MDLKDRAELVRAIRFELKQNANDHLDEARQDAHGRGRRATPQYRRPRYGRETANQYIRDTAEGGDASFAEAAERWDRQRLKLRGRQRRGVRPAPQWGSDGYVTPYRGIGRR